MPSEIGLTQRQAQILAYMMQGDSNKLICRALNIAEATVKNQVTVILKALNVTSRTQAVLAVVPRKGARFVAKTLKSAIANAEDLKTHHKEYSGMDTDALLVKEAVAQTATTYKRFTPKARGSAGPILKRNCHIKIVLTD